MPDKTHRFLPVEVRAIQWDEKATTMHEIVEALGSEVAELFGEYPAGDWIVLFGAPYPWMAMTNEMAQELLEPL